MTSEVAVFKLKNGNEVLGTYDDIETDEQSGWRVYKPMVMAPVMTPQGPQMTLQLWFQMCLIEEVYFDASDVFVMGTPPPNVAQAYIQVTTGIAVPPPSQIITGR